MDQKGPDYLREELGKYQKAGEFFMGASDGTAVLLAGDYLAFAEELTHPTPPAYEDGLDAGLLQREWRAVLGKQKKVLTRETREAIGLISRGEAVIENGYSTVFKVHTAKKLLGMASRADWTDPGQLRKLQEFVKGLAEHYRRNESRGGSEQKEELLTQLRRGPKAIDMQIAHWPRVGRHRYGGQLFDRYKALKEARKRIARSYLIDCFIASDGTLVFNTGLFYGDIVGNSLTSAKSTHALREETPQFFEKLGPEYLERRLEDIHIRKEMLIDSMDALIELTNSGRIELEKSILPVVNPFVFEAIKSNAIGADWDSKEGVESLAARFLEYEKSYNQQLRLMGKVGKGTRELFLLKQLRRELTHAELGELYNNVEKARAESL